MHPIHLGVVTLNGAPQKLGSVLTGSPLVRSLQIISPTGNTDPVFIGDSNLNTTTLAGLLGLVEVGSTWQINSYGLINWGEIHVQGTSGNRIALVGIVGG